MPKAKKDVGYNAVFPTRLRTLLDTTQQSGKKITQQELADAVGVTRQAVGQWCIGNTVPDILCLKKIAEIFGISSDYLIGLCDVATTNLDIKSICEFTGLSEKACLALAEETGHKPPEFITMCSDEEYESVLGEYLDNCALFGKCSVEILSYFIEHELLTALRLVHDYKVNLEKSTKEAILETKELIKCCDGDMNEGKIKRVFEYLRSEDDVFRSHERGRLKYFEAQDFLRKLIDGFVAESIEDNEEALYNYRSARSKAIENLGRDLNGDNT